MLPSLNGETRLHLIVGDPVGQTKSPSGLTGEFVARGANAICVPVQVAAADFDVFMAAAKRGQNIDGIVITIPHKFAALRHCDEASDRARFLGAANVLRRIAPDRWHGDMTDGAAMVAALRRAGCEPGDVDAKRCRSLVKRLAAKAPAVAQAGTTDPAGFGLVVNATPAGMRAADPLPVDAVRLEPSAYVADLITRPAITPLLMAARRRGCMIVTGEDMFAVQAGDMADILLASPVS